MAFIDGKMTAEGYCRILGSCLIESARDLDMNEFTFQQDNDPKHASKLVCEYFRDKKIKLMSWPSQLLDTNPIENIEAFSRGKLRPESLIDI